MSDSGDHMFDFGLYNRADATKNNSHKRFEARLTIFIIRTLLCIDPYLAHFGSHEFNIFPDISIREGIDGLEINVDVPFFCVQ